MKTEDSKQLNRQVFVFDKDTKQEVFDCSDLEKASIATGVNIGSILVSMRKHRSVKGYYFSSTNILIENFY